MPKRRLPKKDFIWTAKLAYVVGLLVTDGNLSKNNRCIIMRSIDLEMLGTFKKCLDIDNKIGIARKPNGDISYRVQFSNVQFYDWLLKIGLSPAKSRTIGPIKIPDEFFADYFRGCIDGDGSIQTYCDKYNVYKDRQYTTQRLFIKLVSASEKHIVWLQGRLEELTGIRGFITYSKPRSERHSPLLGIKIREEKIASINCMDVSCARRALP